jgi:hypothetical protein
MLEALTGKRVRALDFSDDRLAGLLAQMGDRAAWQPFEREISSRLLRVYDLSVKIVRLDATSAKTYAGVLAAEAIITCLHWASNNYPKRSAGS